MGDYIQGDSSKHWLAAVKPVIEQRIAKYEQSETHFALLSVGKSVSAIIEEKIHSLEANELSLSTEEQVALVDYRQLLQEALEKKEKQRVENIRRRHNYIPFILELLTQMAAVRQGDFLAQCSSNAKKTVTVKQKNFA